MSPASACALSSLRRSPARSTACASCRPFSVWRARRQRNSPFGAAPPRAARARCEPPSASRSPRPNAAASRSPDPPRRGQKRLGNLERALGLDWRGPWRDGLLQRADAALHEVAAPEADRVLADPESLGNPGAGPTRQGEQERASPIRLAALA